jgi:hypothetical protein
VFHKIVPTVFGKFLSCDTHAWECWLSCEPSSTAPCVQRRVPRTPHSQLQSRLERTKERKKERQRKRGPSTDLRAIGTDRAQVGLDALTETSE